MIMPLSELKLVICDIDSTLTTSDHKLTSATKKVIDRLHEKGIYFGIASGRPLDEIQRKSHIWGFDYDFDILIGMNGSELWDGIQNKESSFYKLKKEWIKEIIDFMAPFDTNYFIYHHGYLLCKEKDEVMMHSAKSSNKDIVVISDPAEMYQEENAKIMFRVKTEAAMKEIEEFVEQHPNPYYKGFKTQTTLMEFADKRISKAYALEAFCKNNHIPIESVMAFGDTTNDNEMLIVSGWGVCMKNGSGDTKSIADAITEKSNDEDGLADYLIRNIFDIS